MSHYDKTQPGQYSSPAPRPDLPNPGQRKKKMPTWAKILVAILAVPAVLIGGCTAVVIGSGAAETVANSADPSPVISTQSPTVARETPRAPKPVEKAPPSKKAPAMSMGQEQAVGMARSYLRVSVFSRAGLIDQLTSEHGSGFSKKDATYAVDYLKPDWNAQAVKAAKAYLEVSNFSRAGLIEQLESEYGSQFTHAQAVYAATKVGL